MMRKSVFNNNNNEVYKEQQLVYLWELNHEKDISEFEVSARDVK